MPVNRCGGHHENDSDSNQDYCREMYDSLGRGEAVTERCVEYRDELKPEKRLHPRNHGAALFEYVSRGIIECKLFA